MPPSPPGAGAAVAFPAPAADASRLRDVLLEAGFTVDGVAALLGPVASAALARAEPVPARRACADAGPLGALVRCFVLGDEVDPASLPAAEWGPLLAGGRATVDLRPYAEDGGEPWFVVSDRTDGGRIRRADHVLGLGGASATLAHATVRAPGRALDLGTGCGVQALHLARHSDHVVATDVNPRALDLARWTLALSGVSGVELRLGDLYAPVAGERFDVVAANPPFVVGSAGFAYRDSGLPGDELSRRAVVGAAEHLAEGGTATLLANWLHRRDEDWRERVAGWLAGLGCDALLLQRSAQDCAEYVGTWMRDAGEQPGGDDAAYSAWLDRLEAAGAQAVGFGVVVLRRTDAADPSVVVEELADAVLPPLAPYLAARVGAPALLRDRALAGLRPVLAPALVDVLLVRGPDGWAEAARTLRLAGAGIAAELELDELGMALLAGCDGDHDVASLAAVLAPLGVGQAAVEAAVADLLRQGVLRLDDGAVAAASSRAT